MKGVKDFHLKAKSRIWSQLSCVCHIRSTKERAHPAMCSCCSNTGLAMTHIRSRQVSARRLIRLLHGGIGLAEV